MKLTIELVPKTCWFSNLRSNLDAADWTRLKRMTSAKAGARCEICGGRGPQWPVECHEIWRYDDISKIQTLAGLVALCPACHECKHIGLATVRGRVDQAVEHLARVNGISVQEATAYVDACFVKWEERSFFLWRLDLSWLEQFGISPVKERK